jgi:hypothetical protein
LLAQPIERKVPIRLMAVNLQPPRSMLLALALSVVPLAANCGPVVKTAAFRASPNTVRRGDLLGPFTGKVVDADSQAPLSGVRVWCSWGFVKDVGDALPYSSMTKTVITGADGTYDIAALSRFPTGFKIRLARFSLIAYKKGFVAYRHDRIFGHHSSRHSTKTGRRADFAQRFNQIRLNRWSTEQSHAQHLLFLGGDKSLRDASAWERKLAAKELNATARRASSGATASRPTDSPSNAPTNESQLNQAALLLNTDEVRTINNYRGAFKGGVLPGRTDANATYHLRAVNRSERYDIAVRLWRLSGAPATALYEKMLNALADSRQKDELADRNFVGERGEIRVLGLLDQTSSSVVLVTCGKGQCPTEEKLFALGKKVEARLAKLPTKPLVP